MADGVKMTFKPGSDSTKFIGPDGWVAISRGGIDAHPKSLLTAQSRSQRRPSDRAVPTITRTTSMRSSRGATVSPIGDAVRSDIISQICDIAVRSKRKITWDPKREAIVDDAEAAKMLSRPHARAVDDLTRSNVNEPQGTTKYTKYTKRKTEK